MKKYKSILMIGLLTLLTSCANRHSVLNTSYDLNRVERIGIVKFDTRIWGIQGTEDMFAKYLMQSGFRIIERAKIDNVLREHQISAQGYLSPETTKMVGKILGVDALMMGNVISYKPSSTKTVQETKKTSRVEPVYETKTHTTPSGNTKTSTEKVGELVVFDTTTTPVVHRIYAEVGVTAKLVDVETAEIIWIGDYTGSGTDISDAVDTAAYYLTRRLMKDWKKALEAD